MLAILLLLIGCTPADLGHESYARREAAESRLRAVGLLAVPALIEASRSECPETRYRANRILSPWRCTAANLRAADAILSPWRPSPLAFWRDHDLRLRVRLLAMAHSEPQWGSVWACPLHPANDPREWNWFAGDPLPWSRCNRCLDECRKEWGKPAGWPFE